MVKTKTKEISVLFNNGTAHHTPVTTNKQTQTIKKVTHANYRLYMAACSASVMSVVGYLLLFLFVVILCRCMLSADILKRLKRRKKDKALIMNGKEEKRVERTKQ